MRKEMRDKTSARDLFENTNEKGTVRLDENVIISVVKMAACSVDGVLRLAGAGSIVDSIASMIGHRKSSDAITVSYDDNKLVIEMQIVVVYGVNIPKIGQDVQMAVMEKVKETTGLDVSRVNIIVQGIEETMVEESKAQQPETKEQ